MPLPARRVAALLFASGLCALVYQVAWLRLLRLVFGASTAASAAVLAIFMAGLGWGSVVLGRRVDTQRRPLVFYARLEAGIAVAAAASPWLIAFVRQIYLGLGGTAELGTVPGTLVRLALSAVVLALPTFLMGGTLPAAARAVERSADQGRRLVALLYGANTLGAVCGALLTTFVALEQLGIRGTIWAAAGLNFLVALAAFGVASGLLERPVQAGGGLTSPFEKGGPRGISRSQERGTPARPNPPPTPPFPKGERPRPPLERDPAGLRLKGAGTPPSFIAVAAAAVGFVFLLMELVWYRMLTPILGGSSYTFGLILAVALLGVGAGGLLYALGPSRRPTLLGFAGTCAAEALAIAVPYALGDRLAVVAMLLRPLGDLGFLHLTTGWFVLTGVVVLPAAMVAGYQFPMLIGLLGTGERRVGREVGWIYGWNTAGAIAGSLVGGFGLVPLLGAPRVWSLVALLLVLLAVWAWMLALRRPPGSREPEDGLSGLRLGLRRLGPLAFAAAGLALLSGPGPSAVWRHTPTGAGGMPSSFDGPNGIRLMSQAVRRAIVWERDGRESSIAIHGRDEISLLLNGKADGSALRDAPTQVMSGLVGAVLHPDPRRALVIGLGTGSSAGWLAEVPSIERVDVVELEPATREVAERCAPVNHAVLEHPKVRLLIGDGREHMLTSSEDYDLIFSEPSNPYRAGIASLFTVEFYRAAASRLGRQGIFLQWLQAYHIDSQVVRTALATLATVFPNVESWQVHNGDLLLVASRGAIVHDLPRVRERVEKEPLRSALRDVLGVEGPEGFYTGFLASAALARAIRKAEDGRVNTDDRPIIEFGFARGLGRDLEFRPSRLASLAAMRGEHLPSIRRGRLDWRRVLELRSARNAKWGLTGPGSASGDPGFDHRAGARDAYVLGDLTATLRRWRSQDHEPSSPFDRLMIAEALADAAEPAALRAAEALEVAGRRVEAAAVRARFHYRSSRPEETLAQLLLIFRGARERPWVHRPTLERSLELATLLARDEPAMAPDLFAALAEPFSVRLLDEARLRFRLEIARASDFAELCAEAMAPFEPHVPWEEEFLRLRLKCYLLSSHPSASRAQAELDAFFENASPGLSGRGLS